MQEHVDNRAKEPTLSPFIGNYQIFPITALYFIIFREKIINKLNYDGKKYLIKNIILWIIKLLKFEIFNINVKDQY